jgi:hypothetical protein
MADMSHGAEPSRLLTPIKSELRIMDDIERHLENRESRRLASEARFLTRYERQEKLALALIGHLQGESGFRYYVNLKTASGLLTGRIREFKTEGEAIAFLMRNNYV